MITRYITIGLAVCALAFSASAQQNLEELVKEANANWMFGKWQAESDNGTVTIELSWDLEKHVILLHAKTPDMESKGYTAKMPGSEDVVYVSFDNRGSVGKGKWAMENEELVLRVDQKSADRTWKMAVVFGGSESKGLQVRVHRVEDSGDLETPARIDLKLKKQK
jgi:hypothetical protein